MTRVGEDGRRVAATAGAASALRMTLVLAAVGLIAGLAGVGVTLLLHAVQHAAYFYPSATADFLDAVLATPPAHRLLVACVAGVIAAWGWWVLDRWAKPRVTIERALRDATPMPLAATTWHAFLQIVTVALGSPLGREVAPREIAAAYAQAVARRFALSTDQLRTVVACGAGAGLAAVYNVPLAGFLFTLEVLLRTKAWRAGAAAALTAVVAVALVRLVLGDVVQYRVPSWPVGPSLLVWAAATGPLFGVAGFLFGRAGKAARPPGDRHTGWTIVACLADFVLLGLLAGPFPDVLGNGKGPAQVAFDGDFTATSAAIVLALKVAVVLTTIRAGAYGGLLTPAIACGALLAVLVGEPWSLAWPGSSAGAYALVGATAFLAASMAMPLTAVALLLEMTDASPAFAAPLLLAVAGATVTARWCDRQRARSEDSDHRAD